VDRQRPAGQRLEVEHELAAGVRRDDLRRRMLLAWDLPSIGACESRDELVIEQH